MPRSLRACTNSKGYNSGSLMISEGSNGKVAFKVLSTLRVTVKERSVKFQQHKPDSRLTVGKPLIHRMFQVLSVLLLPPSHPHPLICIFSDAKVHARTCCGIWQGRVWETNVTINTDTEFVRYLNVAACMARDEILRP